MSRILYPVDNLISEVRYLLDEINTDTVDNTNDILPALNRGQEYAFDIYARYYPDPVLAHVAQTLVAGTSEYEMPQAAFEDRLLKVEITIPGNGSFATQIQCKRISYMDISEYEATTTVSIPTYYCIVGRNIRYVPTPNGVFNARIWYVTEPERLVPQQGRITTIGSGYVNVDVAGSNLSTTTNSLNSYINFVNFSTGKIKCTMQISGISGTQISLRSSPIRSSVESRSVVGTIDSTVAVDDYICQVQGTCVPFFGAPTANYMVHFAVAEIKRKLGVDSQNEDAVLKKFEEQVEKSWAGREMQMRIAKKNPIWGSAASTRRIYPRTN